MVHNQAEYDKNTESNTQHGLLRMCFEELQEEVGWILHGAGSLSNELEIPVHAAMLLGGFYPAFEERELDEDSDDHEHPEHFLSNMFRIGGPGPALQGEDICFKKDSGKSGDDASEVLQINPFWGDFFDVAHTGSASLLGNDIAKGCDLKRSSDGNLIFLYNTLCAETPTSGENCENHRNYLHAVETCSSLKTKLSCGVLYDEILPLVLSTINPRVLPPRGPAREPAGSWPGRLLLTRRSTPTRKAWRPVRPTSPRPRRVCFSGGLLPRLPPAGPPGGRFSVFAVSRPQRPHLLCASHARSNSIKKL